MLSASQGILALVGAGEWLTGCKWTFSPSQIAFALIHFWVGPKPVCHPLQSQPSLLPEGDGSPEPGPKTVRGLLLYSGMATLRSASPTGLDSVPWAPAHLGAGRRASEVHLELLMASSKSPGKSSCPVSFPDFLLPPAPASWPSPTCDPLCLRCLVSAFVSGKQSR